MAKLYITEQYQNKILGKWDHAIQQMSSRIKPYTNYQGGLTGKSIRRSLLDELDLANRPDYNTTGATPEARNRFRQKTLIESTSQNTHMIPQRFERFVGFEKDDKVKLEDLDTPVTEAMTSLRYAIARMQDDVILGVNKCTDATSRLYGKKIIDKTSDRYLRGGIFGVAKRGLEFGVNTTDVALPDTATIDASVGSGTISKPCGLTIEKLMEATALLSERNVYSVADKEFGSIVMLVSQRMLNELIASDERFGNSNFGFNALRTGVVDTIAGIRIVLTNDLPCFDDDAGYITSRAVLFNPRFLDFGEWAGSSLSIEGSYSERVNTFSVDCLHEMGSARRADEPFVTIDNLIGTYTVESSSSESSSDSSSSSQGS